MRSSNDSRTGEGSQVASLRVTPPHWRRTMAIAPMDVSTSARISR